jgi:hypothetical protein
VVLGELEGTVIVSSGGKERRGMSYISAELKSESERYILVEAIDIVIRAGVWNIYIAEGVRNRCTTPTRKNKDVQD